jgi:hypothetical protein
LCTLPKCKIALLCWGAHLCYAVLVLALCFGWSWTSVYVRWDVL